MLRPRRLVLDDSGVVALGDQRALIFDEMLGPDEAARLREEALRRWRVGQLRPAGIGRGATVTPAVRGDFIAWLERDDPIFAPVFALFEALAESLAQMAYLGTHAVEAQLAVYPPGAAYALHRDRIAGTHERRMTVVYYANDWRPGDGGELELHESDGVRLIEPIDDRLVVFQPQLEHAVREVEFRPRVAISGWLR